MLKKILVPVFFLLGGSVSNIPGQKVALAPHRVQTGRVAGIVAEFEAVEFPVAGRRIKDDAGRIAPILFNPFIGWVKTTAFGAVAIEIIATRRVGIGPSGAEHVRIGTGPRFARSTAIGPNVLVIPLACRTASGRSFWNRLSAVIGNESVGIGKILIAEGEGGGQTVIRRDRKCFGVKEGC